MNELTSSAPAVEAQRLTKTFEVRRGFRRAVQVRAVHEVSFSVARGSTFGLVGESGCGKSTTAKMLLGLERPTSGGVLFDGKPVVGTHDLSRQQLDVQAVFQSPSSSLSPRLRVDELITEPLIARGRCRGRDARREQATRLLDIVGLGPSSLGRFPHEFSGGQQQRLAIARALSIDPSVVILDEPVSALDVSIRAQIINLLMDLQEQRGIAYVLIAHDIAVVEHMSHEVGVMYLGEIVERGPAADVVGQPKHPYTRALINAVPVADPEAPRTRVVVVGEPPNPMNPPPGCAFHPRCPLAMDICKVVKPAFTGLGRNHWVACHLYTEGTSEDGCTE
jgi:oligopeptide/dipeptide ABC transporter ATP-binding protein